MYGGELQQHQLPEVGRLMTNLLFQREVVGKLIDTGGLVYGEETINELAKIVYKEEEKHNHNNPRKIHQVIGETDEIFDIFMSDS